MDPSVRRPAPIGGQGRWSRFWGAVDAVLGSGGVGGGHLLLLRMRAEGSGRKQGGYKTKKSQKRTKIEGPQQKKRTKLNSLFRITMSVKGAPILYLFNL